MLTVFLAVLGITVPNPSPNATCMEVLHQLRSEHRLGDMLYAGAPFMRQDSSPAGS
jgi:hypothetical protein